ncbi:MAG: CAAD domain-containing protein [Cylindrospermopsis raciborskii]|uniref:CAAD domain-containing protein n=1 Tax=Cylindrospermopsis raciborskii TaxID=77022 RepID=UPI003D0EC676
MEVEMQEPQYTETKTKETPIPDLSDQTGSITKLQSPPKSQEQWLKYGQEVSNFLGTLPEYLVGLFDKYKQPILTLGLIVTAGVTVKVILAVLDSLNDIPLVAPTFELIGIGYSGWFVYRYLLKASTREELTSEIDTLKSQVFGQD